MLGRVRAAALALMISLTGCAEGIASGPTAAFADGAARFPPGVEWHIQRIEQRARLATRMAHKRVPGVSIAVVNGGVVEWARGYGLLEATGQRQVNQDTLFQAASVSKPVTAMAALRLVQDGRLFLDEDVNVRLTGWKVPPSPEAAGRPVTLRLLLSHSAGVTVHGFRGYAAGERIPSLADVFDGRRPCNSPAIRVDSPPGVAARYSGGGFVVVQQLLGDVLGARFDVLMRSTVLEPLGMTHSTFAQPLPEPYWPYAAAGHRNDGQEIPGRWFNHPEMAAAGLWTTPTDLARFVIEVQNAFAGRQSRLLSQPIAAQMLTEHLGHTGLGVAISGRGYGLRFQHGGSNQGFRAEMVGLAYTGQGAVVMTNGDEGASINAEIIRAIAAEYGWPDTDGRRRGDDREGSLEDEGAEGDRGALAVFAAE